MSLCRLLLCLALAAVAYGVRSVHVLGHVIEHVDRGAGGTGEALEADSAVTLATFDPDSEYHARRVARAVAEGGTVAARDPLLAWPAYGERGAPIPWPPYYDALLAWVARQRGAVAEEPQPQESQPRELPSQKPGELESSGEREPSRDTPLAPARLKLGPVARHIVADTVARAPAWCAALAAAAACFAAMGLVRRGRGVVSRGVGLAGGGAERGAAVEVGTPSSAAVLAAGVVAGLGVALSFASLRYSYLGMGDHHAAVSALYLVLLALVGWGLAPESLAGLRLSAVRGASAGLVAGAMLGTWVASLALILPVQASFLWLVWRPRGATRPASIAGLGLFAASFHKALLLALLPAVLVSPWNELEPFDVVNLSWFHIAWFGVSWLAFAPLVFLTSSPWRRAPSVVAGALLAALVWRARSGGQEALAWVSASNSFMGAINESQPFESVAAAGKWLGFGAVLGLPALVWAATRIARRRQDGLLPWVLAVVLLAVAAALQRRFAEVLAGPLAVLLGWFVGALWSRRGPGSVGAGSVGEGSVGEGGPWFAVAAAIFACSHFGTLRATSARWRAPRYVVTETGAAHQALAEVLAPLRSLPAEARGAVLAEWDQGHTIEWCGDVPTLATNFGSYLGRELFLDPWRFFFWSDDAGAEALLERRGVRFVLVTLDGQRNIGGARAAIAGESGSVEIPWPRTLKARLGATSGSEQPSFLRLVAAAPLRSGRGTRPYARLYELVRGAEVVLQGEPGAVARVAVSVEAAGDSVQWSRELRLDLEGRATLRVPYSFASEGAANLHRATGAGWPLPVVRGRVTIAERAISLTVTDGDVRHGHKVRVTGPRDAQER